MFLYQSSLAGHLGHTEEPKGSIRRFKPHFCVKTAGRTSSATSVVRDVPGMTSGAEVCSVKVNGKMSRRY